MILKLDKFHEECGVVAVYSNPEAAKLTYLGLHALQHRGQESAGIVASNGKQSVCGNCTNTFLGIAPGASLINLKVLDERKFLIWF